MSRNKSEFLGAAGKMFEIQKAIVDAVLEKGGSDVHLERILKEKKLRSGLADLIIGTTATQPPSFSITVDYAMSLEEMVKAGRYDWFDNDVNAEHFPISGQSKASDDLILIHFNRPISSEDVLKELDRQGFRVAILPELLAFGATYPDEQRKYPIVALGSVWQGPYGLRYVSYLGAGARGRYLDLSRYVLDWRDDWRFAAFRK